MLGILAEREQQGGDQARNVSKTATPHTSCAGRRSFLFGKSARKAPRLTPLEMAEATRPRRADDGFGC